MIHPAVQDMQDENGLSAHCIEDEVLAVHRAANALGFVSGYERKSLWEVSKRSASLNQLRHEGNCPTWTIDGDRIADAV